MNWLGARKRKAADADYRSFLQKRCHRLHLAAGILGLLAGVVPALLFDPRLHPEYPDLLYWRAVLAGLGGSLLLALIYDRWIGRPRLRGRGPGWLYTVAGYGLLSNAFLAGRLADDANYLWPFAIAAFVALALPLARRHWVGAAAAICIVVGVALYRPNLASDAALYALCGLGLMGLTAAVLGVVLEEARHGQFLAARAVRPPQAEADGTPATAGSDLLRHYERKIGEGPPNARRGRLRSALAQLMLLDDDNESLERGVELLQAALVDAPRNQGHRLIALVAAKRLYTRTGQRDHLEQALALGEPFLTTRPAPPLALAHLADAYRLVGNAERALELVDQALELDPGTQSALTVRRLLQQDARE